MSDIVPQKPLYVMYHQYTDQLGISAESWDAVLVIDFVPFVRYQPDRENYKTFVGSFGYAPLQGMVNKTDEWDLIGEL